MPSLTDFLTRFGWPELIMVLAITLVIASSHEWRNVLRLFESDADKK